ncbi:hypothetical protein NQ315_005866 [Exocentrus adspersus]|uniref:Uncharacterized protein n=1 Tax=Exocentrus adspersus TaxID=1586481 RepID=A0AAV8VS58_9CUCU|nr:hypothetical protein NQ315_005866 [Exocentrus adspersus]
MADIEARREARRRKILENSERRLKKISGVEERNSRSELDGINLNTSYVVESESILGTNSTSDNSEGEDNHQLQDNGPYDSLELQTIFYNPRSVANESVSNCYVEVTEDKGYYTNNEQI